MGVVAGGASSSPTPDVDPATIIDGAHAPPLLTFVSEKIRLRYVIVCPPPSGDVNSGEPCEGGGEVYIRSGGTGSYTVLPLRRDSQSLEGRYYVDVPAAISSSPDGFSYYAVLRNEVSGATMTLPSGGSAAPTRVYLIGDAVRVNLGAHEFGHLRPADARVVSGTWGSGAGQLGYTGGPPYSRTDGPSAFAVGGDGSITMLDEANGRLERFGSARGAAVTGIDVSPAVADMAIEGDGTVDVVEPSRSVGQPEIVSFAPSGEFVGRQALSDRTWSALRAGSGGLEVQQLPSEQWMPVRASGHGIARAEQARLGHVGMDVGGGRQVVVYRTGTSELRLALLAGGRVDASWDIVSGTSLGEVQLAEPFGSGLLVVVKAYSETQDEFLVLTLTRTGLASAFSAASAEWAAAAPLARFHLVGSSLYQLGSTPAGAFVDRFDLGGN